MEVTITNDEIVIKLQKTEHKELFDRVPVMRDVKAYFEYLLRLDKSLNGTDDVLNGFPNAESYEESIKKMSKEELIKEKEELLDEIFSYIEYINSLVPEEYTCTTYDYDLEFIPEDNAIAYLKLEADKLATLIKYL